MKKIFYIVTIPDWGGAQKYVADLARKNSCKNFGVAVASGRSAFGSAINLLLKCKKENINCHQFKHLARRISPAKDLMALWEIKKYIEKERPDYLHLNSSKAGILGSFAAALSKHKPKVWYTVHGWVFNEPMPCWRKKIYIFLERLASKWRHKVIVLGEREKQTALKYKICPEGKLRVRKQELSGVRLLFDKATAQRHLGLPENKKIFGTIANFYPAKGLNYLIEAAARINNPDIVFAVIGGGPEKNNYEMLINNYNLQNKMLLLGEKENAAQYLSAFDIFILPSVKEGAPFTILEAMHADLPIIATDVGSISEMLEDYPKKTIIPPADTLKLSQAILENI